MTNYKIENRKEDLNKWEFIVSQIRDDILSKRLIGAFMKHQERKIKEYFKAKNNNK